MKKLFNDINKQVQESEKRWKEIDELSEILRNYSNRSTCDDAFVIAALCKTMLLVLEQLRPLQDTAKIKNLQKDINAAIGDLAARLAKK